MKPQSQRKFGFGRFFACLLLGAGIAAVTPVAHASDNTVLAKMKVLNDLDTLARDVQVIQADQHAVDICATTSKFDAAVNSVNSPATVALQKDGDAALAANIVAAATSTGLTSATPADNPAGATTAPPKIGATTTDPAATMNIALTG